MANTPRTEMGLAGEWKYVNKYSVGRRRRVTTTIRGSEHQVSLFSYDSPI